MTGKQQREGQRAKEMAGGETEETQGKERKRETKKGVGQGIGRQEEKAGEGEERRGGKGDRDMDRRTVIHTQGHTGGAHERGAEWNTDRQAQRWEETDRNGKEAGGKKEKARERVRQEGGEGVPEDRRCR